MEGVGFRDGEFGSEVRKWEEGVEGSDGVEGIEGGRGRYEDLGLSMGKGNGSGEADGVEDVRDEGKGIGVNGGERDEEDSENEGREAVREVERGIKERGFVEEGRVCEACGRDEEEGEDLSEDEDVRGRGRA